MQRLGAATIVWSHPWEEAGNSNGISSNTKTIRGSSNLRLDTWEEDNGTIGSGSNRTLLLDLDVVADSDFVGSRGRERVI